MDRQASNQGWLPEAETVPCIRLDHKAPGLDSTLQGLTDAKGCFRPAVVVVRPCPQQCYSKRCKQAVGCSAEHKVHGRLRYCRA